MQVGQGGTPPCSVRELKPVTFSCRSVSRTFLICCHSVELTFVLIMAFVHSGSYKMEIVLESCFGARGLLRVVFQSPKRERVSVSLPCPPACRRGRASPGVCFIWFWKGLWVLCPGRVITQLQNEFGPIFVFQVVSLAPSRAAVTVGAGLRLRLL